MLKLIEADDSQPIFINPRFIETLIPVNTGTLVRTTADRTYSVKEKPEQIIAMGGFSMINVLDFN